MKNIIIFVLRLFPNLSLKILKFIESKSSYLRGKGFGSFSISQEINQCIYLLNKNPSVVIDIGGNIGEYSKIIHTNYPQCNIHIFEPAKSNISILRNKFKNINNIYINSQGLSDKNTSTFLYADKPGSGMASLTKRNLDHININFDFKEEIQIIKFEEYWLNILQSCEIDIIKMDVEGHEMDVLNGFGNAIHNVKILQFEFGGSNIDTRTFFKDFYEFFSLKNFKIYRITPLGLDLLTHYSEESEYFVTTNYIATKLLL